MNITDLMTQESFSAFLQAYHQRLHDERSFPPLGVQKALHTASPIFGFKNWQAMQASTTWTQTNPGASTDQKTIALVIEYRESYTPGENEDLSFIEETDLKLFPNEVMASSYLHHLIGLRSPLNLVGAEGPEVAFGGVKTSDYSLAKWVEFAQFALSATLKIKGMGEELHPASTRPAHKEEYWVIIDYKGQHNSPHRDEYVVSTDHPSQRRFFRDLTLEDIGALSTIVDVLRVNMDEQWHPLHETNIYNNLVDMMIPPTIGDVAKHLVVASRDDRFTVQDFIEFFEAAVCASVTLSDPNSEGVPLNEDTSDVAEHVLEMQEEYGFQNDADSVRGAVEESANLLNITLNEDEIVQACDHILNH